MKKLFALLCLVFSVCGEIKASDSGTSHYSSTRYYTSNISDARDGSSSSRSSDSYSSTSSSEDEETDLPTLLARGRANVWQLVTNMRQKELNKNLIAEIKDFNVMRVDSLLQANADPNATDANGLSALLLAVSENNRTDAFDNNILDKKIRVIMALLLQAGANPNAVDPKKGRTALMLAFNRDKDVPFFNGTIVKGLVPVTDLMIEDRQGLTVLDHSTGWCRDEYLDLLANSYKGKDQQKWAALVEKAQDHQSHFRPRGRMIHGILADDVKLLQEKQSARKQKEKEELWVDHDPVTGEKDYYRPRGAFLKKDLALIEQLMREEQQNSSSFQNIDFDIDFDGELPQAVLDGLRASKDEILKSMRK